MILKYDSEEVIRVGKFNDSIEMSVDLSDSAKIMYLLSTGLYPNPEKSVINEYASNMLDTMKACGKDILEQPCIVGLDHHKIWFKDFGEGVSQETMNTIISKFGASTRSKDENMIGVMGLGCKSGFSVSEMFTWESNHNGVKRTWLFSKNGIEFNITPLSEEYTDEENGTTIYIPIKDYHFWKTTLLKTLIYYKGIIIELPENQDIAENYNKSRLYEGKNFFFKEQFSLQQFHVVLDQVIYDIDLHDLDIPYAIIPIGIKMRLDEGLIPTPSKDSFLLTDSAKQLIRERLKDAILELEQLKAKQENEASFINWLNRTYDWKIQLSDNMFLYIIETHIDKLYNYFKLSISRPNYFTDNKILKHITENGRELRECFYQPFEKSSELYRGKHSVKSGTLYSFHQSIYLDIPLTTKFVQFFKEKSEPKTFFTFKRRTSLTKGYYNYYECLGLKKIPKSDWRKTIIAFQKEQDDFLNSLPKLSDYQKEFTDWVNALPKKKRTIVITKKTKEEINIRFPKKLERSSDKYNCTFESTICEVDSLTSNKLLGSNLYIYSTERDDVDKLWHLHIINKRIVPVLLNKTEIYKISNLKNFMNYKDFVSGKSRFIQKYITALIIYNEIKEDKNLKELLMNKHAWRFGYKSIPLRLFEKSQANVKWKIVKNFLEKWKPNAHDDNKLLQSLVEVYQKNRLLDIGVLQTWESLKKDLELIKFLNLLKNEDSLESQNFANKVYLLQKKEKVFNKIFKQ